MKTPASTDVERRLRLRAEARRGQAADPELGAILSLVAERRGARRMPTSPAGRVAAPLSTPGGTVLERTAVGPDIVLLRVARPSGFSFRAGQSVKLGLRGGARRSYTIASSPSEPALDFCIERIAGGSVSPALTAVSAGDRVELGAAAKGSLTFESSAAVHVMLATATGIAPFRSMLRELSAQARPSARVLVVHGSSYADRLPHADELQALAAAHPDWLRYVATISRPGEPRNRGWSGREGRVEVVLGEALSGLAEGRTRVQVYACGNSGMIAATGALCAARGVAFKSEAFD